MTRKPILLFAFPALMLVLLAAVVAYLRLDEWTRGAYTRRLRLILWGALAVAAGVLLLG